MITQNSKVKSQNQILNPKNDLKQRTYQFSMEIIKLVGGFSNSNIYRVLGDQLLRSATSIGANIVEAKASSSRRDFIRFYEISLKSANETIYWLSLLKDCALAEIDKIQEIINEANQIAKMLGSSLITLKGKRF